MWVEFVVGSPLCSERFFSRYSGFPLSSKTNISNFQFDPGLHRHYFLNDNLQLLVTLWVNKVHILQLHFYIFFLTKLTADSMSSVFVVGV